MRDTLRGRRPGSAVTAALVVLVLVGCSTAVPASPGPTEASPRPTAPPGQTDRPPISEGPSRAGLITQAVADGRIDLVTGLVYRAYGLFGLPGLPDEFAAGVPRADDGLLAEMVELMPTLSVDDQAKLQPFLVRPTEPDSIFAAQPTAIIGGALMASATHPSAQCANWSDSGTLDARFKVWACRDRDAAAAERDIATLSAILGDIWGPMTKTEPGGLGPPLPDGSGPSVSREYGGDARIDFYVLDLGEVFYREGVNSIPVTAAAAAAPSPPYTGADGLSRNSSSGFVMVNRSRLGETTAMKQDLIHEFFHVLQFAHNRRGPHRGDVSHWFTEASAVWAETFYLRAESREPHRWFVTKFQTSLAGLEDADVDHQYGAYVWPFFMEQEKGASAVFKAWAGIDPVGTGDFAGVTDAVSAQLALETNFEDFAVRNLNLRSVMDSASLTRYRDLDDNFYDDVIPTNFMTGRVSPGSPYLSPSQSIAPLAARYLKLDIAESARLVTISTAQLSPGGQVAADAIVHVLGGAWERRPLSGGILKFCRDDDGDDIDEIYLVVSNHARDGNVSGFVEASAKESCTGPSYVGGTITWNAVTTSGVSNPTVVTVSGTAELVLLAEKSYGFTAERGTGNTFAYDYQVFDGVNLCTPTHQTGTLETATQMQEPEFHIAQILIQGAPGQDLSIALNFNDEYETTCGDFTSIQGVFETFPGCGPPDGWVTAAFDDVENYEIDCDTVTNINGLTRTGHVSGTLHPIEGPPPSP